jgi:hypothetical protein
MSKKTKRQTRQVNGAAARTAVVSPASSTSNPPSGFNPDYGFVIRDLCRIGVLAGSFIALLVIIAILMPLIQR